MGTMRGFADAECCVRGLVDERRQAESVTQGANNRTRSSTGMVAAAEKLST